MFSTKWLAHRRTPREAWDWASPLRSHLGGWMPSDPLDLVTTTACCSPIRVPALSLIYLVSVNLKQEAWMLSCMDVGCVRSVIYVGTIPYHGTFTCTESFGGGGAQALCLAAPTGALSF